MNKNLVLCCILIVSIFMIHNLENKLMGGKFAPNVNHKKHLKQKRMDKDSSETSMVYTLLLGAVVSLVLLYIFNKDIRNYITNLVFKLPEGEDTGAVFMPFGPEEEPPNPPDTDEIVYFGGMKSKRK